MSGGRFYPIFIRNRTTPVTQFPAWGSVFCWYLVWVRGRSVITKPPECHVIKVRPAESCQSGACHTCNNRGNMVTGVNITPGTCHTLPSLQEGQWSNKLPSILIYWLAVWSVIAHLKLPGVILKCVRKVPIYGRSVLLLRLESCWPE